jgi:hypothetical protein
MAIHFKYLCQFTSLSPEISEEIICLKSCNFVTKMDSLWRWPPGIVLAPAADSCYSVLQCMHSRQPLIIARRENYRAHLTQSTGPIKNSVLHSYWFKTKNKIAYIARQTTLRGTCTSDEQLQRYTPTYTLNFDLQLLSDCYFRRTLVVHILQLRVALMSKLQCIGGQTGARKCFKLYFNFERKCLLRPFFAKLHAYLAFTFTADPSELKLYYKYDHSIVWLSDYRRGLDW